ncbi:sensor histidine kinase [Kribbella sp. NPDC056861]|uniref:sensor histidine kinase n=1 Tax=Kribbella sp. NPDC056861 TaxID=3154857 RepID=UPI00344858B6
MADPTNSTPGSVVDTLRLEVHPSVVFKLGADLITDDMQALVELIKNSYDADASRVRVTIDTLAMFDRASGAQLQSDSTTNDEASVLRGAITIVDDGVGMDLETIRRGWLTVSLSDKARMKSVGETTSKSRTPLGDKGLGRLGAQRLGDRLVMATVARSARTAPASPLQVTMTWSRFAAADRLGSVPIEVMKLPTGSLPQGTRLEIRGLRDPEFWKQARSVDFERELASVISPYEDVSGFRLSLSVDGTTINLRQRAQEILTAAPVSYTFRFDGTQLNIEGRFSTSFLRPPQGRDDIAAYEMLVESDNGHAFAEWLLVASNGKRGASMGLQSGDDKHFLHSNSEIKLATLPEVEVEVGAEQPISPGPFHGEVSGIPLTRDTTSVFDSASEYRKLAKALVGIKVYRDGFGVRVDEDWLGLGAQWTSGGSFYSLRPGNATGYVSISARDNAALEETTNREAFRDTPAHRNFILLMKSWADYTARVQEHIRRGFNEYRREVTARHADVSPRSTPESLLRRITDESTSATDHARKASGVRDALRKITIATQDLVNERTSADNTLFRDPALTAALNRTIDRLKTSVSEADALIQDLDELVHTQSRLRAQAELLAQQLRLSQEQIGDAWESVALGLSAEALAHEVQHISDGLRGRSAQITKYLKSRDSRDQRLWTFVEHVRSSASALNKQVSRLTPSLRFMRERRDTLLMSEAMDNLKHYYEGRWGSLNLQLDVVVDNNFSVRMNEGKLTQIMDNLLLNSEYWLTRLQAAGQLAEGRIVVTVDNPFVTVEDNGIGIDPAIEELIFDPFITTKPSQNGRGLGLFVVKQLMDSIDASITLTPDRNQNGHRYRFRLNFHHVHTEAAAR